MFSVPVKLHIHRHNPETNKIKQIESLGSHCGGIMTIIVCILSAFYLVTLLITMFSGDHDIINRMVVTNSFGPEFNEVNIANQTKFMPHV